MARGRTRARRRAVAAMANPKKRRRRPPATSGPHDPSPLPIPPHVYPAPIPETKAVHNLEHGAVILYYRQSGDGALGQAIVDRLATIAKTSNNTILAPYPNLPSGAS